MQAEFLTILKNALAEDIGSGDVTVAATIPSALEGRFRLAAREKLVVCGLELAAEAFRQLSPASRFETTIADGAHVAKGTQLGLITGPVAAILTAERVALNLLQRMSAVATLTRQYVDAVAGTGAVIRDTRKTMPGLRALDKYAVRIGGGTNHRMGLYDEILIKDNHIAACGGSITNALRAAQQMGKPITLECDTLTQVEAALKSGIPLAVILLDNMSPEQIRQAVRLCAGRVKLEASGGITLANIRNYAETGVNYIAIGALTHSAPSVDIGLDEA